MKPKPKVKPLITPAKPAAKAPLEKKVVPKEVTPADKSHKSVEIQSAPSNSTMFVGHIDGLLLSIDQLVSGTLVAGQKVTGTGVAEGTVIAAVATDNCTVTKSQTVQRTDMKANF